MSLFLEDRQHAAIYFSSKRAEQTHWSSCSVSLQASVQGPSTKCNTEHLLGIQCSAVSLKSFPTSMRWLVSWVFLLGVNLVTPHCIREMLLKVFHCCTFFTIPAHSPLNQLNLKSCSLPSQSSLNIHVANLMVQLLAAVQRVKSHSQF